MTPISGGSLALAVVACAVTAVFIAPALILLVQVLAAGSRVRACGGAGSSSVQRDAPVANDARAPHRPWAAILIPAHNEEAGLPATLRSVCAQLGRADRVLVVADNCDDGTAEVARRMGGQVAVTERQHAQLRGKGFALDHGVRVMAGWPEQPGVVLIIDADCVLEPGSIEQLARTADLHGRPVQALNLMHAPPGSALKVRIAEFAWLVKNQVRPTGMRELGLPCQLMGTGMTFPWGLLRDAPLATDHLVEDIKLGTDLATQGLAPMFCDAAAVHSNFPTHESGLDSQRRRWEMGHLSLIAQQGLPLLAQGIRQGNAGLLSMAADLCVPPLASLVVLLVALCLITGVVALGSSLVAPFFIALAGLVSVSVAVVLAWHRHARHLVSGSELLSVPAYVCAKLPIYVAALAGRRTTWVRTGRERE